MPTLTAALRAEYESLFNRCVISPIPVKTKAVNDLVKKLLSNRARYQDVSKATGVPWHFIAVIHNMESGQSFAGHLHNGDPLNARTVQVPKGRPLGPPPFTWEVSATDALGLKKLDASTDWSLAGTLYRLELYNGWGYRNHHPETLSPYLWSYSNHYVSGKYVKDGVWSPTEISKQCGAAVLLRRMAELGEIAFPVPAAVAVAAKVVPRYAMKKSTDASIVAQVESLQRWLSGFPQIFLKVDGVPGQKTSDAYKAVTGSFLPGDPRA
ncbi:MAG: hypothetical protein Q8M37_08600 [Nevskia sp.]|nr:hypothetical protein [Nevskia sp.]